MKIHRAFPVKIKSYVWISFYYFLPQGVPRVTDHDHPENDAGESDTLSTLMLMG